jgi:hypothetical protein
VLAVVRRDRVTLALAGGIVVWVVVEMAFALHGWPGLPRYMFEAGGVVVVLAGVGIGWLLSERALPSWVGPLLVLVLVASLAPAAVSHARVERRDLREQRVRTAEIDDLARVVDRLGGVARLRGCGEPLTRLEYQSVLAYTLKVNVSQVGFKYAKAIAHGNPIVMFTPFPTGVGWVVGAMHQVNRSCLSLPRAR